MLVTKSRHISCRLPCFALRRARQPPTRVARGRRVKRLVHQVLAKAGLHIERVRDPYVDAVNLAAVADLDLAVDGGAYKGVATQRLLEACPGARVLAFEPMPDFAEKLRTRFASEPRVRVIQKALSDENGSATFHVHATRFTSSLHEIADPAGEMQEVQRVVVEKTRLDDVLDTVDARSIVVKLDLQGHEHAALLGMSRALTDGRIRTLIAEVNFARRYAAGCSFADIVTLLGGVGFGLHRLYELRLTAGDGYEIGDAVFVRDPGRALLSPRCETRRAS